MLSNYQQGPESVNLNAAKEAKKEEKAAATNRKSLSLC